jgi:ATP-dependent DNA ligase
MQELNWKEFRLIKSGRTQVWRMAEVSEDTYCVEHGLLDGKMQRAEDTPGSKGKESSKAYVSPHDNMLFHMEREARKKMEGGYREFIDGELVGERADSLDWSLPLPKHFCPSKPKSSIEPEALEKLYKSGRAIFTRKVNGFCHVACHHVDGWRIYSRRMDDLTEHFPLHVEKLNSIREFGVGTILTGEMVVWREGEVDDFKQISRFCRSLQPEARQLVASGEVAEPIFIIFDMVFHNGKDLKDYPYRQRSYLWREPLLPLDTIIRPIGLVETSPALWSGMVKDAGWEGLVVVDGSAPPGEKFYSFTGKSERPNCSWKLKPVFTEDVKIIACSKGTGKRMAGAGAIHIAQIHPDTNEWLYCGKCGSGFSEEALEELEERCLATGIPILNKDKEVLDIDIANAPGICCEIEFYDRQPGTNKFLFPIFIRFRDDKGVDECVAQKLNADDIEEDEE